MPVSSGESGSASGSFETEEEESEDEIDVTLVNLKQRRGRCRPLCTAGCFCHTCYIIQFVIYLLVFPLWAKWLVTSPMPTKYWNQDFPPWPVIPSAAGRAIGAQGDFRPIEMTRIPSSPDSCNYSCVSSGALRAHAGNTEVAFEVGLTLNDPKLVDKNIHAVYPVLLASEDFQAWYVVGDRRHAYPTPFWSSKTKAPDGNYLYVTQACTQPPAKPKDVDEVLGGVYILACVTWQPDHFSELLDADTLTMERVGALCSSVGGVCGWSCGATIDSNRLPGCESDSRISVTSNSVAGLHTAANFQGKIQLQECMEGTTSDGGCMTSPNSFQHWSCPQCKYDPNPVGSDMDFSLDEEASPQRIYTSLPQMKVTLMGVESPKGSQIFNQPRVVMLRSSVKETGVWKKLYMKDAGKFELPVAVDAPTKSPDDEMDEEGSTVFDAYTKQAMILRQPSRIDIAPSWCYGPQGPLYLVACAVNSTLYESTDFANFTPGQKVAPPPFNDRCVAVSGRCGSACDDGVVDMHRCTADGYIEQSALVATILPQKNDSINVWLFVFLLLLGFAVKVAVFCPGIFRSYPHFRRYDPSLTEDLRFIVVCVTSSSDNRALALRSLIGAVGALPAGCSCRYHVAYLDEGHRPEHKALWMKFCHILAAIPSGSFQTYEENVRQFFHVWVEETNKLRASELQENLYGDRSQKTVDFLSGKTTLKKLKISFGWQVLVLENLENAIEHLHEELRVPGALKKKWYLDDITDWLPTDTNSLALRLHYLARASPPEDERTLKTQHVAPGTWYYEVPQGSGNELWLSARQRAVEMLHGIEETDQFKVQIPLRTSRGTAGCLNFAANYFFQYSGRLENLYGDSRDTSPALLSVCDARHQFQTDFFHTTVPYFFDSYGDLNPNVGFAQCPKYFPHVQDRADYLDNNDAQFFRLNCMIHNCCGGVSGHGTNSTWKLHRSPDSLVWELAKQRVRDRTTHRKHKDYIETRTFPENCAAEDTAGSLKQMIRGKHSHFISRTPGRRLSYGVAKTPAEHLVSVQKSIQAHFVLSLQSFFRCATGFTSLWATFLAFCFFVASLFILLTKTDLKWQVVEWGWVKEDYYNAVMQPARNWSEEVAQILNRSMFECDQDLLESFILITLQIAVWVATLVLVLFIISIITETCKFVQRICLGFGSIWPDEMRWWGRLLILVCNLTHFLWAWMPLFWIGFNLYNVFDSREFHYSPIGMFIFTLILQVLNWGMIGASCMRHSLEASMEANEVVMLTIDNIWRSTQRYYITAPLTVYSMVEGMQDYIRFHCYGQDITFNDKNGKIAVYLVKYWTLLLEVAAVFAWVYFCTTGALDEGGLTSLIIITVIALDVLHPCAYLWVGETTMTPELANSMSWYQAFTTLGWWELLLHDLILNDFVTGFLKWLGPAWMIAMPLLTLVLPYLGVNQAFMLVATVHNR